MSDKSRNEVKAGVFVLLGMAFIVATIFTLGRERQLFESQEPYHIYFKDVKGLSSGAPVRLGGITIGRVDKINFSKDLKDNRVHVTVLVNEPYLERIRVDSKASIQTQGLLGDRMMSISSGTELKQLPPGATIESEEPGNIEDVMVAAGKVAGDVAEISETVKNTLAEFRTTTMDNLSSSVQGLSEVIEAIQTGDGVLHQLIYTEGEEQNLIKELTAASVSLNKMMNEAENGSGLLNALIYEPRGKRAIKGLVRASESISQVAEEIEILARDIRNGDGLLHSLIYSDSPEGVEQLFQRLAATAKHLETVTAALAEGSGTLGALLMDSSVYDNMVEVTDEAKRSFLLRTAIRSSLKYENTVEADPMK